MDDGFDIEGVWWLPGNEGHRVAGSLTFSRDTGARLRLIGTFRDPIDYGDSATSEGVTTVRVTEESLARSGSYPYVLGECGSTPYTIQDCIRVESSTAFNGLGREVVSGDRVFKGVHFADGELDATIATANFKYLNQWLQLSGINVSINVDEKPDKSGPRYSVQGYDLPRREIALNDSLSIELRHRVVLTGDRIEGSKIGQRFWWRASAKSMQPASFFVEYASDIQDLVSIATNRVCEFDTLTLARPDVVTKFGNGKEILNDITYYARWNARDKNDRSLRLHDVLFNYSDIGELEGVRAWLQAVDKHRSCVGRVMASRYSPTMFVSDAFLNRAAALESFDREIKGDDAYFRARITRCAETVGDPIISLIGDVEKWSERVKDLRNDVAHHLGTTVASTSEQYYLAESLYWLFAFGMLKEASLGNCVELIAKHDTYRQLIGRYRASVRYLSGD